MKKIIALILCVAFLLGSMSFLSVSADEDKSIGKDGYTFITKSSNLSLYVNTDTADFYILDKRTGKIWNTVSEAGKSLLNITYSGENNLSIQKDTEASGVSFELFQLESGIKTVFFFNVDNAEFEIPVKAELYDDSLKISVLFKDIKEKGSGKILEVTPYPNLGIGRASDNGYAFIPDGSGAVIDYKDSNSKNEEVYKGRIYGDDPSQDLIYKESNETQTVKLPVFGVKQGKNAFLGIIEKCDEYSYVNAGILSKTVSVNPSFIYHESDLTGIQQSTGGVRTTTIVQSKPIKVNPVVNYIFLVDNDASYSGMARCYRNYLINKKVLTKKVGNETPAASFEVFGATSKSRSFLGISIKKMVYATTFNQLIDFEKKVNKLGITNADYYLYGFLNGGYEKKTVTAPEYPAKLGGKKGYKKFVSLAGKSNVYTAYDIMRSYGKAFDFFRTNDYTKSLNQTVVEQHYKNPATGEWDADSGSYKYYNVEKQKKYFTKLFKNLDSNTNIILSHIGGELPSDFTMSDLVNRAEFLNFYKQVFSRCNAKKIGLGFEYGNAYTLSSAKEIHEAPLYSGDLKIESYSVPFYTMVFHGYLKISSTPVNEESNCDSFMLNAFEQGVSSTFRVAGCDGYRLKETNLNFLYNAGMNYVLKNARKFAGDYNDIHSVLFDKCIIENKKSGNISVTEYENNWKIVCNYGKDTERYGDTDIKPNSYVVIKE